MNLATRVIVVGARGFIGQRVLRSLEVLATAARAEGAAAIPIDVVPASRTGALAIDLTDPSTFERLRADDVVVDASSSAAAQPDALAQACLERGATLLVTSSDRGLIERLISRFRHAPGQAASRHSGQLVLGAGIFTGVSNVLACAAARALPGATSLELAVSSSPFSGAGKGTVDLMVDSLAIPARRVVDGAWVDAPSVSPGPTITFPSRPRRTLEVPLAEPAMLAASTQVPNVRMFFAPKPGLLRGSFLMMPRALLRVGAFRGALRLYFSVLRRALLRGVPSSVEIVATARSGSDERVASLSVSDGMVALGVSVAATVDVLRRRPRRPGTVFIDEVVALSDLRAGMAALAPADLRLDWREP